MENFCWIHADVDDLKVSVKFARPGSDVFVQTLACAKQTCEAPLKIQVDNQV
jgi:hypothetical protein